MSLVKCILGEKNKTTVFCKTVDYYLQTGQMATEQRLSDQVLDQENSESSFCTCLFPHNLLSFSQVFADLTFSAATSAEWSRKLSELRWGQLGPLCSCGLVGQAEAWAPCDCQSSGVRTQGCRGGPCWGNQFSFLIGFSFHVLTKTKTLDFFFLFFCSHTGMRFGKGKGLVWKLI